MAQVTSDHIWYPGGYPGTAYDLRQIVAWYDIQPEPLNTKVRFIGDPVAAVTFVKADFETAKQTSLDNGG